MYAKIIPLKKFSRGLGVFDYAVPDKIKEKIMVGQLVEIPFRNNQNRGIIISLHNEPAGIKLKEILRIADNNPFLTKVQLDLIAWTSFYYCSSPAILVKNIIPEIPSKKIPYDFFKNIERSELKILKSTVPFITQLLSEINTSDKILLQWTDFKNKIAVYLKLLEKFSENRQAVIIFPQLKNIEGFIKLLPEKLRKRTNILNSEMSKTGLWQGWNNIRNSTNGIIIGTRQALFSPIKNPGLIIIDEEQNQSHKQWDQNPRCHSLQIAVKLSELTNAKLLISSMTPSIETFFNANKKGYKIINENPASMREYKSVEIIKMQNEWGEKNYTIFSEKAIDELKKAVKNNFLSIIYINRRGLGSFAVCKDCGHIPQCPRCFLAMSAHKDLIAGKNAIKSESFILKCHHCGHTEKLQIPCLKCHSFNILLKGTGTEKIETELKKVLPQEKLARVDLDNKKSENKLIFKNIANANILIGTKALLNYNMPRNIGFILFINIDTDLQTAGFKASEETIHTIADFKSMLSPLGKIIIQTYSEINYLFAEYDIFYKKELEQRKKLNYPPFSQLIKLTYKNKDSKIIKFETDKIYNLINKNFSRDAEISLFGPVTLPVRFGKYAAEIVIKNTGSKNKLQEWFIKNIPPDWIIDIDPIEI
ncbi:MAG: primosomal protein N' [bacterium]